MARKLNNINFGSGFNITATSPIDSRTVVDSVEDLTSTETWSPENGPLYQGIPVTVKSTGDIYVLVGKPNEHTDINSWKKQIISDASQLNMAEDISIEGGFSIPKDTVQKVMEDIFKKVVENEEVVSEALLSIDEKIGDLDLVSDFKGSNVSEILEQIRLEIVELKDKIGKIECTCN